MGNTVNQFDAPFCLAKLTALFVLAGRELLHSFDRLSNLSSFCFFAFCCSSVISASLGGSCSCDIICSARGAVTLTDAWNLGLQDALEVIRYTAQANNSNSNSNSNLIIIVIQLY